MSRDTEYCDHCAYPLKPEQRCVYNRVPFDLTSVNEGEDATLCSDCFDAVVQADNLMEEAHQILRKAGERDAS